ncbi:membrane associated rhomboid family serine protease [Psychromicrobium silvestre]|uniref:Membrane associated rhomboid family serine protease n=1 Tax=Psychromicrobium silvestre TaxID=1645614 RepID=A0A7Y9LUR1_9MICC|nr:rhomboid family intramembrane serine protease [Psychromicrobium silvestre]NYE95924.1 membrane associated rhomboid family serine protease [Psychromicrobium silvestre]
MSYGVPTAANSPGAQVPVCPRHPDRVSYVRCQRCGRPACTECQRQAAVGIQCVDCVRETAKAAPVKRTMFGGVARGGRPVITFGLIALCVLVFIGEWIPGLNLVINFGYAPVTTETQPWRMLTSVFTHSTGFPLHILLNMYSLYVLGSVLEPIFGRLRFFTVFLISGLAGSVGVLLIGNPEQLVVGASGGIFGLFGALFVLQLKRRGDLRQILVLLVINAAIGFFVPGIAWQAHLGGLIGGALVAAVMLYAPAGASKRVLEWGGVVVVLLILLVLTVWGAASLHEISKFYVF